ncbi:MAG TPA: hypothetical protein VGU71_21575 [Candidatus Dormibacteraeota bacterium]|nr:hypothetical protein [Candidatus Dormibacteraeota bacterium]
MVVFVIVLGVLFVWVRGNGGPSGSGSSTVTPGVATGPVTASTPLSADRGHVVFTDNFRDSNSGWKKTSVTGATYTYANGAYNDTGSGLYVYFASSPYREPHQQLSVSIKANLSPNAPVDAGIGVGCGRGSGSTELRYELIVFVDGSWTVQRRNGVPSDTGAPITLKDGSSATAAGSTPVTVVGVCATLSDGHTTRIALFIDGTLAVDLTDTATTLADSGWIGSILLAASDAKTTTMTVSRVEERDIAA